MQSSFKTRIKFNLKELKILDFLLLLLDTKMLSMTKNLPFLGEAEV